MHFRNTHKKVHKSKDCHFNKTKDKSNTYKKVYFFNKKKVEVEEKIEVQKFSKTHFSELDS